MGPGTNLHRSQLPAPDAGRIGNIDENAMSTTYRHLSTDEELREVAAQTEKAWMHPMIPVRQYEIVAEELGELRRGDVREPFAAFQRCLGKIPMSVFLSRSSRLLDVGASSGFYSEVLRLMGYCGTYTGLDYSASFAKTADVMYPGLHFDIGDARHLPYHDDWFDIVMSGGTLMHIYEWRQALAELARCSARYVLLHRTPVVTQAPTLYFEKEAYGVKCLELWFAESELLEEFTRLELIPLISTDI